MDERKHQVEDAGNRATYFAPAERADPAQLSRQVETIKASPVVAALLKAFGGWVAILNEHRQILALNHAFLRTLGVEEPGRLLGLRPGEALDCRYALDAPGGCGTGQFCRTCGAAIAIVGSMRSDQPEQRECVLSVQRKELVSDHDFLVRTFPFDVEGKPFLLISMRETTEEKRRMAFERSFLHDMANILTGLCGAVEAIAEMGPEAPAELLAQARDASRLMSRELHMQRMLVSGGPVKIRPETEPVDAREILSRLEQFFSVHPAAASRTIRMEPPDQPVGLRTDVSSLLRVLINLVLNALEAGSAGDTVAVRVQPTPSGVSFRVWNAQPIPPEVAPRIFQRFFSTKGDPGRGMGSHGAKLLTESVLGGSISFQTSQRDGTTFRVDIPRDVAAGRRADRG